MYHGWNDQLISPGNTINYYNSVVKELGPDTALKSIRLFMVPGMDHCVGGDGPSMFDGMAALEQWVEQQKAPEQLIAAHLASGKPDRTRPLCSVSEGCRLLGNGSTTTRRTSSARRSRDGYRPSHCTTPTLIAGQ